MVGWTRRKAEEEEALDRALTDDNAERRRPVAESRTPYPRNLYAQCVRGRSVVA